MKKANVKVTARIQDNFGSIEVGIACATKDGLDFGTTATVYLDLDFNTNVVTAQVGMGSIGSHDTETARKRIAVYTLAADIADTMNTHMDAEHTAAQVFVDMTRKGNLLAGKVIKARSLVSINNKFVIK